MAQDKRATRTSRAGRDDRKATALEREAIASAKAGDWDALHFLYVRYADDVKRFVQSIVHDSHEAEDITQDVFAKLILSYTVNQHSCQRDVIRAYHFHAFHGRVNMTMEGLAFFTQLEQMRSVTQCATIRIFGAHLKSTT